jgi:hypothetical protein
VPTLISLLLAAVTAHASSLTPSRPEIWRILSNTKGVDFGPYLSLKCFRVRAHWYNLIPVEARPPQLMPSVTSIEFTALPGGKVAGMHIVHPSGSLPLDRAACGGITQGNLTLPYHSSSQRNIWHFAFASLTTRRSCLPIRNQRLSRHRWKRKKPVRIEPPGRTDRRSIHLQ